MQEKAQKDADKLLKNFKKIQKKADKLNNKDIKLLDKEMEKLGITDSSEDLGIDSNSNSSGSASGIFAPKFSEITSSGNSSVNSNVGGTVKISSRKLMGTVSKRLNLKKSQEKFEQGMANSGHSSNGKNGDFTISEVEDGKRSVRHLKGRRQSANILFVPKKLDVIKDDDDEIDDHIDAGYLSDKPMFLQVRVIYCIV